MYNTQTNTNTYTVVDIRKTFESCEADIRTIARRTGKWSTDYVDKIMHDIIKLAENKYLDKVSIALKRRSDDYTIRAAKFKINEDGNKSDSDRAGRNNDWQNIDDTYLTVYLSYTNRWRTLSSQQQKEFYDNNDFKIGWVTTSDDTTFSHLTSSNAQLYASKGYELQKTNYK
ncbi:hypothetical protein QSE00_04645 [Arenibacter sp. M-2]|uniref:HORMA-1 domain-containing protein n=1 Tax=Arenibacter sp. M-2 TaxID=3053612 RepID=UPI000C0B61F8|nr:MULTISPECIES: hypothetical protein [Flavobacteriaceae]MAU14468.1 hypothetical protein [Allomuricauda sp.]MDL5511090.1 hypothetical protein [Arenibacter sp. M-2]|tara:strand:- start:21906 stop:22421 length:516 start_codon:yes stop_codon:yes gene_type:complete